MDAQLCPGSTMCVAMHSHPPLLCCCCLPPSLATHTASPCSWSRWGFGPGAPKAWAGSRHRTGGLMHCHPCPQLTWVWGEPQSYSCSSPAAGYGKQLCRLPGLSRNTAGFLTLHQLPAALCDSHCNMGMGETPDPLLCHSS